LFYYTQSKVFPSMPTATRVQNCLGEVILY
jgi:hypothetical protein